MTSKKGISLSVGGSSYDQWTSAEVSRDIEDISGAFSFTIRAPVANARALDYVSMMAGKEVKKGDKATISVDGQPVMIGWVEEKESEINENQASVTISGRDLTGDLIDCSALPDGPAEMKNVKLEAAVKKIAAPYGLKVRSEVDTGDPFDRYSIDLSETSMSAIEKGTRSRKVLILSDGIGGLVITRAGAKKAPDRLVQPGNIKSARFKESDKEQYSETTVRGQGEHAGKKRKGQPLDASAEPLSIGARTSSGQSKTETERQGTVATGKAKNGNMKRYRPMICLARSKADAKECQDEADWKQRTSEAKAEELVVTVHGFRGRGGIWRINEMVPVQDGFHGIDADLLIKSVIFRQSGDEMETELTVVDPGAYDPSGKGKKKNKSGKHGKSQATSGALDGKAEAL